MKGALFTAVAFGATIAAHTPLSVRADVSRLLIEKPDGRWQVFRAQSGSVDARLARELGVPGRYAGLFEGAYVRTWVDASRTTAVRGLVIEAPSLPSASRFMAGAVEELSARSARVFLIPSVTGAQGFAWPVASGEYVHSVVLKRDRVVFVLSVVSNRPRPRLARAVAEKQDQRTEGDAAPFDAYFAAGGAIAVVAIYLAVVKLTARGVRTREPVRWSTRLLRRGKAKDRVGDEHRKYVVDLTAEVRARKRVARAAGTLEVAGALAVVPAILGRSLVTSLLIIAGGVALLAIGVALGRGRWLAAVAALSIAVVITAAGIASDFWFVVLLAPFLGLVVIGVVPVLRNQLAGGRQLPRAAGYRRAVTGKRLVRVGALLAVAVLLMSVAFMAVALGARVGVSDDMRIPHLIGVGTLFACSVVAYRQARRHAALRADAVTRRDERAPILYLRSFGDDQLTIPARTGSPRHSLLERFSHRSERFEEVVAGHLWAYGPVIAVGVPGERLAPIGAARTHYDDATWKDGVQSWLSRASLVVITVGGTAGVAWEVRRIAELGLWDRAILLVPPRTPPELQHRWRAVEAAATAAGAPLDLRSDPGIVFTACVRGDEVVAYIGDVRDEWHYEAALHAAAQATLSPP
jgi:hypothetical protein